MAATHLRLGGLARSVTHGAWVQGQQAERCMDEQSRQEAEGVQGMSCGVARCMGWWFWRGRRAEGAAASRLRQGSGLERRRGNESQARAGMRRDGAGSGLLGRGASGNEAVAMQKAWDGGSGGADARRLLQQAD